jgi:hypothetical protein
LRTQQIDSSFFWIADVTRDDVRLAAGVA